MTFCFWKVIHHKAIQSVVVEIENENVSISTHKRDINNVVNKIKKPEQLIYTSEEVGLKIERITGKQLVTVNQTRVNDIIESPSENGPQTNEKSRTNEPSSYESDSYITNMAFFFRKVIHNILKKISPFQFSEVCDILYLPTKIIKKGQNNKNN